MKGNWLGYDCVGGVVDSIRDVLGFNFNQFNDFNVSKLQQQDWLTQIDSPSTGNLVFKDSSHVMTYNQWFSPQNNKTYNIITTHGSPEDGAEYGDKRMGAKNWGYTTNKDTAENWSKIYKNSNYNWGEIYKRYGNR